MSKYLNSLLRIAKEYENMLKRDKFYGAVYKIEFLGREKELIYVGKTHRTINWRFEEHNILSHLEESTTRMNEAIRLIKGLRKLTLLFEISSENEEDVFVKTALEEDQNIDDHNSVLEGLNMKFGEGIEHQLRLQHKARKINSNYHYMKCVRCPMKFKTLTSTGLHYHLAHNLLSDWSIICNRCSQSAKFADLEDLMKHVIETHISDTDETKEIAFARHMNNVGIERALFDFDPIILPERNHSSIPKEVNCCFWRSSGCGEIFKTEDERSQHHLKKHLS